MTIGNCPHGKFDLEKGCPQCIEERRAVGIRPGQPGMEALLRPVTPDPNAWRTGEEEKRPEETALSLRPGEDIEVHGYFKESQRLLEYAEARVIASLEDNKAANDDLNIISKHKKAMEAKRKEYLDPLKAQSDAIRDTYNYLMNPILEAEKITKGKMLAYDAEQRRIRQEQEEINRLRMEAAQAEMKLKGELTESVNLVEVTPEVKKTSTDLGTAGMRDNWQYEVTDVLAVPREYLVIDSAMLNAIAKKHHDAKPVPGVRFFNKPVMAVRAR